VIDLRSDERERLITWLFRLGFALVGLLTVYLLAIRP